MVIKSIVETSFDGMYKIQIENDDKVLSFFVRNEYLKDINIEEIYTDDEFDEEQTNKFMDAGLICIVELKAIDYLARAEQSRFGLSGKLLKKGYEKQFVEKALDFLESKNYLSDQRFATAWLNTRKLNHYEGRTKLLHELQARGISKDVSEFAVKTFFEENDETEICMKACQRFIKKGKSDDKLVAALMNAGFSYKLIKIAKEECLS